MANQGCFDYLKDAVNAAPPDKTLKGDAAKTLIDDVERLMFSEQVLEQNTQNRGDNPATINFSNLAKELQNDISSAERPEANEQTEPTEPTSGIFDIDNRKPFASPDIADR